MKELLYGAAYYDEYMPYDRLDKDVEMMKKAGINTVRIAESTWSTCEPQAGEFDFSHVERVMDAMEEAGINVIIGTPTYAVPTWMVKAHPDVLAETVKGRGIYGARQIMDITPYAVLSFLARAVGRSSVAELLPLLSTLVLSYILCAVQSFGVEGLLVKFVAKLSPIRFFKGIAPAQYVAFTTQSSVGTIPVTLRQLKEALGVDADVASFTAGLGANVGMPACAGIWPALTAVFSVHMLGYHYGIAQYAFLILITLVVSVGTVGVPGTATITSTAVFAALGLPIELVVVFAPISTIVDMARTMTNVTGAATAAVITAATEGLVDEEVYNSDKSKHVAVNN